MLNNVLGKSSRMLSESKDKIVSAAKKRANEEVNSQIPSPADLEVQLRSLQTDGINPEALLKAEKVYNKFISLIDKAIMKLEATKGELESIKMKLDSITDNLNGFNMVIDIAKDAISLAKGVLAGFDGALAASSSTFSNGLIINKTGEKKKDLKDNLKKARASIDGFSSNTSYFNTEIDKLMKPLNKGISGLEEAIQKLKNLRAQIVAIYEKFILSLSITELNDEVSGEGLPDELNEDDLDTILSDGLETGNGTDGANEDDNSSDDSSDEGPTLFTFKKFN
jgi:prefoldin subunit 5